MPGEREYRCLTNIPGKKSVIRSNDQIEGT